MCDSKPASKRDISAADWMELREARDGGTLCPDCQDKVVPRDVQPELYGMAGYPQLTCMRCLRWPGSTQ